MNDRLKAVMEVRYKSIIEDCKYKIKCYSDQEIIIPEHPDITLVPQVLPSWNPGGTNIIRTT